MNEKINIRDILIIDDEIEVCMLLSNYLTKKEKKAEYATTLADGISAYEKMRPQLLILDNNLPDGYGVDHISLFREKNPEVCIALISARSDLRITALEKGADYFIEKPISFNALNAIIENRPIPE
jgi:DNA-binding response OmpR family regulator